MAGSIFIPPFMTVHFKSSQPDISINIIMSEDQWLKETEENRTLTDRSTKGHLSVALAHVHVSH